jgi:hypothetical protein
MHVIFIGSAHDAALLRSIGRYLRGTPITTSENSLGSKFDPVLLEVNYTNKVRRCGAAIELSSHIKK